MTRLNKLNGSDNGMTRIGANRHIIHAISKYAEQNPDLRFGQILSNLGILETVAIGSLGEEETELFISRLVIFEESTETLEKLRTEFIK
jgi:hypothetical protein